ncbi:MAG: sensor histidine kinase [Coriobacteriia bacterium]|nr:sensor histidine kinase [Coriobacteriia bacterium]
MSDNDNLLDFVGAVSGEAYLKVEENLGEGFVRLRTSEAERRQAKHDIRSVEDIVVELLRNARDAHAQRIFIATTREGDQRLLTMIDDGVGIPSSHHEAVFEPRVTSKLDTMVMDRWGVHGRGMALFSVRASTATCRIAASDTHRGTAVTLFAENALLPERADQSSWPTVERNENGLLRVSRGPHNIIRRVLEFACEHPELDVYLGSPAEVAATLCSVARATLDTSELLFCDAPERFPVWQRPASACDASDFVTITSTLGLPLSERTAHRILAGELAPVKTVLSQVQVEEEPPAAPAPDIYRDRRSLKIHHADLARFKQDLTRAFDDLAERYYLHLKGEPKVNITRDGIRVRFEVDKEE